MNSNGEFFIGRKKYDATTGEEIDIVPLPEDEVTFFDNLTINKLTVNNTIDASTAVSEFGPVYAGITTVTQLSIIGLTPTTGDLYAQGISTFVGVATFGGSINVTGVSTFNNNVNVGAGASFIGKGVIPVGGIIMWSGSIAELGVGELSNWALCDGSTVSGRTTPDLRNRFVVGAHSGSGDGTTPTTGPGFSTTTGTLNSNYTPGNIGGETAHQLTINELASHTHTYGYPNSNPVNGAPDTETISAFNLSNSGTTGSTGSDQYHENRPPYYALAFIMRVS